MLNYKGSSMAPCVLDIRYDWNVGTRLVIFLKLSQIIFHSFFFLRITFYLGKSSLQFFLHYFLKEFPKNIGLVEDFYNSHKKFHSKVYKTELLEDCWVILNFWNRKYKYASVFLKCIIFYVVCFSYMHKTYKIQ